METANSKELFAIVTNGEEYIIISDEEAESHRWTDVLFTGLEQEDAEKKVRSFKARWGESPSNMNRIMAG